jgi:hypothetical protein
MKNIDIAKYPPGQALYANFGGGNPKFEIPNIIKFILFTAYHIRMKQSGFRWIIGRVSNVRAMELYKSIGAKVLK